MNAQRRKELAKLQSQAEELKDSIQTLLDEEQEYYDNMPESLQDGEKGERAQAAIDEMENAVSSLEDVISNLETACE